MLPSKPDTYRVILLKNRTVRLKDSLSDTNPLIPKKKKNADPYKKDQATYPQKKKKRKKRKKKRQTLKPKPYIPIKIQTHSNLRFFAANPYTHKSN